MFNALDVCHCFKRVSTEYIFFRFQQVKNAAYSSTARMISVFARSASSTPLHSRPSRTMGSFVPVGGFQKPVVATSVLSAPTNRNIVGLVPKSTTGAPPIGVPSPEAIAAISALSEEPDNDDDDARPSEAGV